MDQTGGKFCDALENIVKCTICHKRLNGDVALCEAGHSACHECLLKRTNKKCLHLLCGKSFTATENLLAKELLRQLDSLKVCLMESDASKYKLNSQKASDDSSEVKNSKFRCWIGDKCTFTGDISTILQHFEEHHDNNFEENLDGKLPFKKSYEMNYFIGKKFNQAVKIKRLIFIIHISVNGMGELGVCIIMYTSNVIADKYVCQMEIECTDKKSCYKNAKIISANLPERVIHGYKKSVINKKKTSITSRLSYAGDLKTANHK
ncbi:hypothetical protein PV327_010292 [Microctonus hyperodae]|uniref:Uncharacterized protein n=1 Tax=Microctonus hyperodae TaxID=165561 RepID=A0AA39FRL2_MICHY|nr:hypothetical protein PV327_010292 [Microctonus hyperodae]